MVSGSEFRRILEELIQRQEERREEVKYEGWAYEGMGGRSGLEQRGTRVHPLGGVAWLASEVGVDPSAVRQTLKAQWVTLGKADEWLTRLGLPHLVRSLQVVPNPHWTAEHWGEWRKSEGGCDAD